MKSQSSILAILAAGVSANYAPPYSSSAPSPAPTYPAPAPYSGDACATACKEQWDKCRVTPFQGGSANMAKCASDYASCIGFNPFTQTGSVFATPTACSSTTSAPPTTTTSCSTTATTTHPATTTPPATTSAPPPYHGDACATSCKEKWDKCRVTPANGASSGSANFAQCASEYASCLGFNPFTQSGSSFSTPTACASTTVPPSTSTSCSTTSTATPSTTVVPPPQYDSCAADCKAKWDKCRVTPANGASSGSANQAQCSAEYAACIGFNPFTQGGSSFSTPTACSKTSVPSSTSCSTTATPTTTPPPNYDACAADCKAKWDKCRVTPANGASSGSANQAQCSAEYAACIGFNPFTQSGTFTTPTACHKTVQPSSTSCSTSTVTHPPPQPTPPAGDECAQKCTTEYRKCQTTRQADGSSANQSLCASNYAACLNYNPFPVSAGQSFVQPTACAPKTTQAPPPPAPTPAPPAPAPPAPAPPSPAPAPPAPAPPAPAPPSPAPAPPAPAPPAPAPPSPAPAPPSTTTPSVPQSTNAATQKGASIFAAVAMAAAALAL